MASVNENVHSRSILSTQRQVFQYQSFFDTTQLNQAIQPQNPNDPIIGNTLQKVRSIPGKLIALHPDSETPIAVRLGSGSKSGGSTSFTLVPGQKMRVHQDFAGLEWGLPFGWLGGGSATLIVANDEEAFIDWPSSSPEVVFHRTRMKIVADANPSTTPLVSASNWPLRFPWVNANRYNPGNSAVPNPQSGLPYLSVTPTRILMRLRVNNLALPPPSMRMIWQGLDAFDQNSANAVVLTDFVALDVGWASASGTSTPYPTVELMDRVIRFGGDFAVLTLTDLGNAALTNQYVDIIRFGKL